VVVLTSSPGDGEVLSVGSRMAHCAARRENTHGNQPRRAAAR
jgi:hypothetical protein